MKLLAEISGCGYDTERGPLQEMLKSVDALRRLVAEPLHQRCGPEACVLTTELHGHEVRGLAYSPGRILRYALNCENRTLRLSVWLSLAPPRRVPAA
ncbi:MAG: hypothetical protein VKK03_03815 [Synechococcus sp.]|nr:hypothetical protein [Synechococcus sp.]